MRIDGYEIGEKVGSDGIVSIYSARRTEDGVPVTVQWLSAQHVADERFREKMRREFEAAAAVDSPFVLKHLDFVETGEVTAIVTEERPSLNLRSLFSLANSLSFDETVRISQQIAKGLYACHCYGVVHRQVAPETICITDDGQIKISNFGFAGLLNTTILTMTGTLIASPEYAPPENLHSAPVDLRGDIYSLGIMIWEMLVGENPFEGVCLSEIFREKKEPLPPPSGMNPDVPRWMDILVTDMTAPDPERRPKSFQQVLTALERRSHFRSDPSHIGQGNCIACGYPVPHDLWFCPYCGQFTKRTSDEDEACVLLISEAADTDATLNFLRKAFGGLSKEAARKFYKKKGCVPVIEHVTAAQSQWITESLRKTGCKTELKPLSAAYFKVATLIFFLATVAGCVLFRSPPATISSNSLAWGFRIGVFGICVGAALHYIRLYYAAPREIPIRWIEGAFAYDSSAKYLSSGSRILSSVAVIGATVAICAWVLMVVLALSDFLQIRLANGSWGALMTDNSFLLLLAQLAVIKLFAGEIYTPPLFAIATGYRENRTQIKTNFQPLERLRELAANNPNPDFRYLIAETIEQYLQFNRFKHCETLLPAHLLNELEERFLAAVESVHTVGQKIYELSPSAADSFKQKAEKKSHWVKQYIDQSVGKPSLVVLGELEKAQDMMLQHETAVEMIARQLNNIRLVVGSLHTVTLQLFPTGRQNEMEEQDLRLGLCIVSEALKAVA